MKKTVLLLIATAISWVSFAQNFDSYFRDGLYKFDDTMRIPATDVFTTYLTQFHLSQSDEMVLINERMMDSSDVLTQRYVQYHNGYPIPATMMNVISKYGIALYINGFSLKNFTLNTPTPIAEATAIDSALQFIGAPKYAWEDTLLEQSIKYSFDSATADTVWDTTKTLYPKGELVIARHFADTSIHDTSSYALCWKFFIRPMHLDTIIIDTSSIDTVVALDTVVKYIQNDIFIVYVNAATGSVYTVDSNKYGGDWRNCGINPTSYLGNRSSQMHYNYGTLSYSAHDSRKFALFTYGNTNNWHQGSINWTSSSKKSGLTAYWSMQVAFDYFDHYHGFYNGPITASRYQQDIYYGMSSTGFFRSEYLVDDPSSTGYSGKYNIAEDATTGHTSVAELDLMAHEYMHSIIQHNGPKLNRYGEAGAIQEALCDIYGTYVASTTDPSRYYGNWANGFGYNFSDFKRSFSNPGNDREYGGPDPGSSRYGDSYFYYGTGWAPGVYHNSGVMRKWFHLMAFGGTHYGTTVNEAQSSSNLELDVFNTIGWMWTNLNFNDARNQMKAYYELKYGECTRPWSSCIRAWKAVGIGTTPPCRGSSVVNPRVVPRSGLGSPKATLNVVPTDEISSPITGYNWIVPSVWDVSYSTDLSEMTLMNSSDNASQMVTCIVTHLDLSKDTLTTFLHIVDDLSPKGTINPKNVLNESSDAVVIYPNPAKNTLHVSLQFSPKTPALFYVTDLTGREVYRSIISGKTSTLYLPTLSSGLYIARITVDGKEYLKKLTIQ